MVHPEVQGKKRITLKDNLKGVSSLRFQYVNQRNHRNGDNQKKET